MTDIKSKSKKKIYCGNCGKYGHVYKKCNEPITSIGIMTFKLDGVEDSDTLFQEISKEYVYQENDKNKNKINILRDNNKNYNNLIKMYQYKNKIKFLLIRRRQTLGYLEFIRGRYETDDMGLLVSLFEQMTESEISEIKNKEFDQLWNELWFTTSRHKAYQQEYEQSKKKFGILSKKKKLKKLVQVRPKYDCPEWGFPKGRRNYHEKNIECAVREFGEETGFDENDYQLLNRVYPLKEVFPGTNGIFYKHVYFMAISNTEKEPMVDSNNRYQMEEIGDIGWFTYDEVIEKLRPYHIERRKIFNELYLFIVGNILKHVKSVEKEFEEASKGSTGIKVQLRSSQDYVSI